MFGKDWLTTKKGVKTQKKLQSEEFGEKAPKISKKSEAKKHKHSTLPWRFLISNKLKQLEFKSEKNIGI